MNKNNPIIHIEDDGKRGGTYLQGDPNDQIIALIGAMQANEYIRTIFERAVFLVKVAEKRGLHITKDEKVDLGNEAEEAFKKFVDPTYRKEKP